MSGQGMTQSVVLTRSLGDSNAWIEKRALKDIQLCVDLILTFKSGFPTSLSFRFAALEIIQRGPRLAVPAKGSPFPASCLLWYRHATSSLHLHI